MKTTKRGQICITPEALLYIVTTSCVMGVPQMYYAGIRVITIVQDTWIEEVWETEQSGNHDTIKEVARIEYNGESFVSVRWLSHRMFKDKTTLSL